MAINSSNSQTFSNHNQQASHTDRHEEVIEDLIYTPSPQGIAPTKISTPPTSMMWHKF